MKKWKCENSLLAQARHEGSVDLCLGVWVWPDSRMCGAIYCPSTSEIHANWCTQLSRDTLEINSILQVSGILMTTYWCYCCWRATNNNDNIAYIYIANPWVQGWVILSVKIRGNLGMLYSTSSRLAFHNVWPYLCPLYRSICSMESLSFFRWFN